MFLTTILYYCWNENRQLRPSVSTMILVVESTEAAIAEAGCWLPLTREG